MRFETAPGRIEITQGELAEAMADAIAAGARQQAGKVERLVGVINEARVHLSDLTDKGLVSVDSADEVLRAAQNGLTETGEKG